LKYNTEKYGLSKEYIEYLQLPKATAVKVYDIKKILNARKKLTNVEKINHLLEIKKALELKLEMIAKGKTLQDFYYLSPQEFEGLKEQGFDIKNREALAKFASREVQIPIKIKMKEIEPVPGTNTSQASTLTDSYPKNRSVMNSDCDDEADE